ncbi:MAG: helix-turn-helix transcriptional regulator [Candidatus Thorarchaeota archaeon]
MSSISDSTWKRLDIVLVLITVGVLSVAVWIWMLALPVGRETIFLAATIALFIALVLVVNVAVLVLLRLQQRVSHLESLIGAQQVQEQTIPEPEIIVVTLTNIERRVINRLEENGGSLTQDELRRATGLSKSTLSVTLKGLERKKLVAREESGRTKTVKLLRSVPR